MTVGDATRREAETPRPGHFAFRPLARVMPKGRAQAPDIQVLAGSPDAPDAAVRKVR